MRAHLRGTRRAAIVDANRLKIRQPPTLGFVHGVADVVTCPRTFTTYITTFRHHNKPLGELPDIRQIIPWHRVAGNRPWQPADAGAVGTKAVPRGRYRA